GKAKSSLVVACGQTWSTPRWLSPRRRSTANSLLCGLAGSASPGPTPRSAPIGSRRRVGVPEDCFGVARDHRALAWSTTGHTEATWGWSREEGPCPWWTVRQQARGSVDRPVFRRDAGLARDNQAGPPRSRAPLIGFVELERARRKWGSR